MVSQQNLQPTISKSLHEMLYNITLQEMTKRARLHNANTANSFQQQLFQQYQQPGSSQQHLQQQQELQQVQQNLLQPTIHMLSLSNELSPHYFISKEHHQNNEQFQEQQEQHLVSSHNTILKPTIDEQLASQDLENVLLQPIQQQPHESQSLPSFSVFSNLFPIHLHKQSQLQNRRPRKQLHQKPKINTTPQRKLKPLKEKRCCCKDCAKAHNCSCRIIGCGANCKCAAVGCTRQK